MAKPGPLLQAEALVLNWPESPSFELEPVFDRVTEGGQAARRPTVLVASDQRLLSWRGFVQNGALALHRAIGPLLREHELPAFYSDPRFHFFVPDTGDVVLLEGPEPLQIDRESWGAASDADTVTELLEGLRREGAVSARETRPHRPPRSAAVSRPPGAEITLVQRYDETGGFSDTWAELENPEERVILLAPGAKLETGPVRAEDLAWRAVTVSLGDERRPLEGRERIIPVGAAHAVMPGRVAKWVLDATETAIGLIDSFVAVDPQMESDFRAQQAELMRQLRQIARPS
jgi:hypothetical protein